MFLIIQFPPSIPLKSLVDSFDYFFIPKLYVAILCRHKGLRNPFLVNVVPILYPLKNPEEQRFSGVFRVSKWEPLPRNGLRAAQKPGFFAWYFVLFLVWFSVLQKYWKDREHGHVRLPNFITMSLSIERQK